MDAASQFTEGYITTAQGGADVFYIDAAQTAVADFAEGLSLTDLINCYCTDPELAKKQVAEYLANLPTNEELVMRSFILFELLKSTRNELADMVGLEKELLAEAARGGEDKSVDDTAISESAGYSDEIDSDVADSSKTDAARQNNVSDEDIGISASEDVSYVDRTVSMSPALTFMIETRRLANGICKHCMQSGDILLQVEAQIAKENPEVITEQILELTENLEPPRDEER